MGGAVGAAGAAAAIAQAIKASGAIVEVEPEQFTRLLAGNAQGLVVHAPAVFSRHKYLMGYRGLVFWTKTREEWMPALSRDQNRVFLELDRATFAAVRERVRALPRDARAERLLEDSLGIRLAVPRGFHARVDRAREAALLLDEGPPARLLRIRRVGGHAATEAAEDRDLREARSELARLFRPQERTLDDRDPMLVPDEMAGATRRLHGRWSDEGVSAAGPYRFYEIRRGAKRYDVDLAVFAPGHAKLPHLRELQVVAESLSEP